MVKLATLDYIRPILQAFIPRFSDVIPKQKSPFSPQTKTPRTPTASSSPSPPPDHHHFLLLFLLLLHIDYRHLYIAYIGPTSITSNGSYWTIQFPIRLRVC